MKKFLLIFSALFALIFASCASTKINEKTPDLENLKGELHVLSLTKNGEEQNVVFATISFYKENGELFAGGKSGVNSYNVPISAKNGSLKVSDRFAQTKMMGAPDENAFERLFVEALSGADSYSFEDEILIIQNLSKNMEIKFSK